MDPFNTFILLQVLSVQLKVLIRSTNDIIVIINIFIKVAISICTPTPAILYLVTKVISTTNNTGMLNALRTSAVKPSGQLASDTQPENITILRQEKFFKLEFTWQTYASNLITIITVCV